MVEADTTIYFGDEPFLAVTTISVFNDTHIVVEVPPSLSGGDPVVGKVQIILVQDGISYSNSTVVFEYKAYASITSVTPRSGPTRGGTLIRVEGTDFSAEANCLLAGTP